MYKPNGVIEEIVKSSEELEKSAKKLDDQSDYTTLSTIPMNDLIKFAQDFADFGNRLFAKTVYYDGKDLTIPEICEKVTIEEIEDDNYSTQTVIDLFKILKLINSDLL